MTRRLVQGVFWMAVLLIAYVGIHWLVALIP